MSNRASGVGRGLALAVVTSAGACGWLLHHNWKAVDLCSADGCARCESDTDCVTASSCCSEAYYCFHHEDGESFATCDLGCSMPDKPSCSCRDGRCRFTDSSLPVEDGVGPPRPGCRAPTKALGETCDGTWDCPIDTHCDSGGEEPICTVNLGAGAACTMDEQCAESLLCRDLSDTTGGGACGAGSGDGDPCATTADCQRNVGLTCAKGACAPWSPEAPPAGATLVGLGEECSGPDRWCEGGRLCNYASDPAVCILAYSGESGDVCLYDEHCSMNLSCTGETCVAAGSVDAGGVCTRDEQCAAGLRCKAY